MAEIPKKGCALITGAGGRLGRLLQAARDDAPELQHQMVFQSRRPGADLQWSPGQPTQDLPRCKAVIALWGVTSGSPDDLAMNAKLVTQSAALVRDLGADRVIHLSSAAVYGPGQDMHEEHATSHYGDYGKSKLDMEKEVAKQQKEDGLTHICLRLANVVGADSLAPALSRPDPATIDDFAHDPTRPQGPIRSYIGAGGLLSVLDGLLTLPASAWPEILNIALPEPISMDALIHAADKDVIWRPAPPEATREVTLDVSRLQGLLPTLTRPATAQTLITEWRRLESLA